MATVRIRYVYETSFFDGRPSSQPLTTSPLSPVDQVDSAINHPIVRRIQQAVFRARKAVVSGLVHPHNSSVDGMDHGTERISTSSSSPAFGIHRRCSISTLQTSMCSSDDEDLTDDGRSYLNRSRSLQQTHLLQSSLDGHHHRGFSLHLSPKQKTKISEAVILSPISDKSENETSQTLAAPATLLPIAPCKSDGHTRRRPTPSLFPAIIRTSGVATGFNSSDSGISISANSLVASHEALQPAHKPSHLSLNNSHELLSSSEQPEENLPFLMPKLRRGNAAHDKATFQQPAIGRQLSLTLPFPAMQNHPFVVNTVAHKDLVDDTVPLEIQSWYHGSITRRDAEKRLRPAPPGSFLVRDSMASHDDYFLAARAESGFLHVRIDCHQDPSGCQDYTLATLPDRRFQSVAEAVNHCANIGVYSRQHPPIILKYPLDEEPV